ncbi:hypothetical protein K6Y31_16175 [Motilimonas cestriensis]|uniref:Uncharacterized protein n=1 Tax=Motilimonas cestriensis TaxID=2742685 RepID=A0ABS8WBE3_9GAMM|nr:hypothetical protein [Motilimonas cestriensis]MCE2596339.1 hypothetical protein [Motilimonas cestriensis]
MKYQLGKTILNSVLITLLLLFLTNLLQPLKAATFSEPLEVANNLEEQLNLALSHSGWAMASTVGAALTANETGYKNTSATTARHTQVNPPLILNAGFGLPEPAYNMHLSAIFTLILLLTGASLYMRQQCQKMQSLSDD